MGVREREEEVERYPQLLQKASNKVSIHIQMSENKVAEN